MNLEIEVLSYKEEGIRMATLEARRQWRVPSEQNIFNLEF